MIKTSPIRLLKDNAKVWLVYSGINRRFHDDFVNSRSVFLNLPGFAGTPNVFDDEAILRQHLARTWAISDYVRGVSASRPTQALSNYSSYPFASGTSEARSFSAEVGNILRLFSQAKVGDLILVPGRGAYAPYLVGEITSKFAAADTLAVGKLGGEEVPVRKVRWLSTIITRNDFPPRVGKRLINRHAITEVAEEYYEEIFNKVYPNYSWRAISKLDIFGDAYSGKDPLQPYVAARLIKYVLASAFAFEKGEIQEFNRLSRQDIDDAIDKFYDESLVAELAQHFNSPGRFTFVGRLGTLSAIAAAGIMLATVDDGGTFDSQKNAVEQKLDAELQGTKSAKDEAKAEIRNYLNATDPSVWEPVQRGLGKPAKDKLGLSLNNSVELQRKKSELEQ